jgi:hypothetical protein
MLPWQRIVPAAIEGPVRVDLYLEQRSQLRTAPRMPQRRMVFDRDGVEADLEAAPPFTFDVRTELETLMRGYWFGAMWPARFMLREDWGGLLANASLVVYQFVVPSMLIADGSPEFYREVYGRSKFLATSRRQVIHEVLGEGVRAFAGIESGTIDLDLVRRFHSRLLTLVWRSFREAASACGATYDAFAEEQYRSYYHSMGIVIPDLDDN